MTRFKWLLAFLAGVAAYVGISVVYGQNGVFAYRELQEQKRELSHHAAGIQKIYDELFLEYTALQNDADVIAAAARKLDYIVPREKLVKITGLRVAETKIYDTGSVLRRTESTFLPDSVCKATGCIIFLGTVLLFLVLSLPDRNPRSGR